VTSALTAVELFTDAREIHRQALERLEVGHIRDAAEKTWCATKRATDALVLSRTNEMPQRTNQTSAGIRRLGQEGEALASLRGRFSDIVHYLHSDCFYDGQCEPREFVEELVRGTSRYIDDAEQLAGV
jgi:hypothetical protein